MRVTTRFTALGNIAALVALSAVLARPANAEEPVAVVTDGRAAATILLSTQPTGAAQFGAFELQHHLKLMTGATLPILWADTVPVGPCIVVGDNPALDELGIDPAALAFEEYVIRTVDGLIVLAGRDAQKLDPVAYDMGDLTKTDGWPGFWDERGTLHAVYDFLERCCGVRWLNQTELGTVCPRLDAFAVEPVDIRRAPVFEFRDSMGAQGDNPARYDEYTGLWTAKDPEFKEWTAAAYPELRRRLGEGSTFDRARAAMARLFALRMRNGGKICRCNHSLYGYYKRFWEQDPNQPDLFVARRPQMFAKGYEGTPPQLCYTSPELVKQLAQDARDYYDGNSTGAQQGIFWRPALPNLFPVEPMDNRSYCKCADCQAYFGESGETGGLYSTGDHSNYFFQFVNKVADELNRTHPEARIVTLAYSSHARRPDFELNPNIAVQFCFAANRAPYSPGYAQEFEILRSWAEEDPRRPLYLWLYYTFPKEHAVNGKYHCFPGFFAHTISEQFRVFHDLGIRGMFHCGFGQQVEAYVTFRLMDDPTCDIEELLDEYFSGLYGKAAEPIKTMYLDIERTYSAPGLRPKEALSGPELNWGRLGTGERMAKYAALMQQAKALADTGTHRANVDLWDKAVWQYMQKGRKQFVDRQGAPVPSVTAPRVTRAGGDPDKVQWQNAAPLGDKWYQRGGALPSARPFTGRIAHDGAYLYLELTDHCDTSKLQASAMVFPCDDWELFIAGQRAAPYRQYAWGPTGLFTALSHGEVNFRRNVPLENPGARVTSDTSATDKWVSRVALPLDRSLPGGVGPGDTIYMNLLRVSCSEISGQGRFGLDTWVSYCTVHEVDRLGEVILQK